MSVEHHCPLGILDEPVVRCADHAIVFEGASRLAWTRHSTSRWSLAGLWPTISQAAPVCAKALGRGRVLVLVDSAPASVHVMREELSRAPKELAALTTEVADELFEVRVPLLDWLPEPARSRGLGFLDSTDDVVARTPRSLLPSVLVEEGPPVGSGVLFGRRVRCDALTCGELLSLGERAFSRAAGAARTKGVVVR